MFGSIFAALAGLAFVALGIGGLLAPEFSSNGYGLPTRDRTALAFVRAIAARDIVLGIIVLVLLAARNRDAVALVLATSVLAALTDADAVKTTRADAGLQHVGIHFGGAAALVTGWALLRSGR